MSEADETLVCPSCEGGQWETECCDGSGGCSCGGGRIPMGTCLVCGGSARVGPDHDPLANAKSIGGYCFIGSGPSSGYWTGAPAMGRRS